MVSHLSAVYNIRNIRLNKSKLKLQQSSRMWKLSVKTVATEEAATVATPKNPQGLKPRLHLKSMEKAGGRLRFNLYLKKYDWDVRIMKANMRAEVRV